jgi:hypothetical protein
MKASGSPECVGGACPTGEGAEGPLSGAQRSVGLDASRQIAWRSAV